MTPSQRKYLEFILDFSRKNKRYPRRREIAEAFGYNVRNVASMIDRLIMNGYLSHAPRKWTIGAITDKARKELTSLASDSTGQESTEE